MQHALRRTAVIIASSAVVLSGAPLLGTAFATSTLTQSSVTPANGSTVQASQPAISASYTDGGAAANLDPASTITVTKGATDIGCSKTISANTITCSYSGLLTDGTYTVAIHAVEASNPANTADNTTTFVVDVPSIKASKPAANQRVQTLPNGQVRVQYDETIDDTHSTMTVQQIADRQADGTYAPASHTPLSPASGSPSFTSGIDGTAPTKLLGGGDANENDTIVFTPSNQPVSKGIYQVTLDVFGTDHKGDGTTKADGPNLAAKNHDSFTFTLDDPLPPPPPPSGATNLAVTPTPVTKTNETSVTFSGNAAPGNTITVDATDGSAHVNNAGSANGGPVTVTNTTCTSSTSCSWSKTFDLTSLADGTINWTATETAPQNSTNYTGSTIKSGPSFLKDATAPANPHVAGSFSPPTSSILHVTGGSDATVDQYKLDITDSASPAHAIPTITLTKLNGDINTDGTFARDVDVSSLDDGTIHIALVALDQYGNSATASAATATKAVGLLVNFNASFFQQVNSDTPSFPTVLARPNHAVQKPAHIAVEFTNPITTSTHDTNAVNQTPNGSAPNPYFVEILPNGADGNTFAGTDAVSSTDNRQLLVTPPAGLADGTYKLHITVYKGPAACSYNSSSIPGPAQTPAGQCPGYDDWIKVPNTSTPFTFTVDSQPPVAPTIDTIPEGTIDGSNVGKVEVDVAGEPGSTVTLTAKSSGGGSLLALNQGQPITLDGTGHGQDVENNAALAVLPDGTITITGTPADAAGNSGPTGTHTVTLAARPSIPRSLSVSQSDSSFTLHWVAPSYDGFAPMPNGDATSHLTGYRYTYQDTTPNAVDSGVHTVTVSTPTATSATQAGLLAGHSYSITLCALNGIDGPCNTLSTNATPAYFTALTAGVSRALVVYGNTVTLSGRLTRTDIGAGIANEPIKVTPHYDNGTTGAVISLTTNSLGNWSVLIKPAKNALYVVTFNATHADANYQPSNSSVRSLVAVSLRIDKVTARAPSHAYPVTVTGHITPNQSGRVVNIYAKASGSTRYQRIGTAKITSASTWSFTKVFGKGKFNLYANFPSQNGNIGANSQTVTFTRS
jgi:hypothetical protein